VRAVFEELEIFATQIRDRHAVARRRIHVDANVIGLGTERRPWLVLCGGLLRRHQRPAQEQGAYGDERSLSQMAAEGTGGHTWLRTTGRLARRSLTFRDVG
jgi:hypothetical protein